MPRKTKKTKRVTRRFSLPTTVKWQEKGDPNPVAAGIRDELAKMRIGTCLKIGSGKRFRRTIPRVAKVNALARRAETGVIAVADAATVVVVIVGEMSNLVPRVAHRLKISRLARNNGQQKLHQCQEVIPVSGSAGHDVVSVLAMVEIVLVTIVVHVRNDRVVNVVRNVVIVAMTKPGERRL